MQYLLIFKTCYSPSILPINHHLSPSVKCLLNVSSIFRMRKIYGVWIFMCSDRSTMWQVDLLNYYLSLEYYIIELTKRTFFIVVPRFFPASVHSCPNSAIKQNEYFYSEILKKTRYKNTVIGRLQTMTLIKVNH